MGRGREVSIGEKVSHQEVEEITRTLQDSDKQADRNLADHYDWVMKFCGRDPVHGFLRRRDGQIDSYIKKDDTGHRRRLVKEGAIFQELSRLVKENVPKPRKQRTARVRTTRNNIRVSSLEI